MGDYELIDRLCGVTTMLADIVKEQAAIIAQADMPDSVKEALEKKRDSADLELDVIEYNLRRR